MSANFWRQVLTLVEAVERAVKSRREFAAKGWSLFGDPKRKACLVADNSELTGVMHCSWWFPHRRYAGIDVIKVSVTIPRMKVKKGQGSKAVVVSCS